MYVVVRIKNANWLHIDLQLHFVTSLNAPGIFGA